MECYKNLFLLVALLINFNYDGAVINAQNFQDVNPPHKVLETKKWEVDFVAQALDQTLDVSEDHSGILRKNKQQPRASVVTNCTTPGVFALTFDDGPSYNGNTESVLQVLQEKGVKATFFVTGYGHDYLNLTTDPRKQELLRRIHRDGHQIASHTFSHESLTETEDPRSREDIINDITLLATAVHDIAGINITLLRPPYGNYNSTVVELIQEEFGYDVVTWNMDTNDWLHKEDIDASFQAYLETMGDASNSTDSFIVLHHDPVQRSGELARMAINYVRSKGFRFVTVGKCIGKP